MNILSITVLFGTIPLYYCYGHTEAKNTISNENELSIIGGYNTSINVHPYQVSISWTFTDGEKFFLCGGFIISINYILSAAHCIKGRDPTRLVVYAGSTWRTNGTIIPIAEVIGHHDFDFKIPMDCDIAIMRTVDPIQFQDQIQPILLPLIHTPLKDNSLVTVSGWGLISMNESNPGPLMSVEIPVVNFYDCWTSYGDMMTRNMWCGGNFELGGKGPCGGDSGGAAVQDGVAVGIVSWSEDCSLPRKPAVFTDIAAPAIRNFITLHTEL